MSHMTCPFCASTEHTTGYGLAAGPIGSYTFCNNCDELIEFAADMEGMTDEQIARFPNFEADLAKRLKDHCHD